MREYQEDVKDRRNEKRRGISQLKAQQQDHIILELSSNAPPNSC
jgi:hypothetical protein